MALWVTGNQTPASEPRHGETFFHQSAKRVSLRGNHCVSTMVQLLWVQSSLEQITRHCWHSLCCTLLVVTRETGVLYSSKHTCACASRHVDGIMALEF